MPSVAPSHSSIPLSQHIPTLLFIVITVLTSTLVSRTQVVPYIDEIFHIPQAQRFCSALLPVDASLDTIWQRLSSIEYDPKLTTPPGLYAISLGLAKVLPGWECGDVAWLRSTNLVLLLTLPVLVARILHQNEATGHAELTAQQTTRPKQRLIAPLKKNPVVPRTLIKDLQTQAAQERPPTPDLSQDEPDVDPIAVPVRRTAASTAPVMLPSAGMRTEATPYTMAVACVICFLPPLWFFGFLYYTDMASIWLVLACWTLYNDLNSRQPRSPLITECLIAMASMLAVMVRQTNIVWVGFCAGQAVLARVRKFSGQEESGVSAEVRAVLLMTLGRRRGDFWKAVAINAAPMLPTLVGGALFIRWNGSIVLGDKSNHKAGLHLPQIGYFLAFASAFGIFPLLFSLQAKSHSTSKSGSKSITFVQSLTAAAREIIRAAFGSPTGITTLAASLAAFYIAADRFTLEHPFLLADNRHYTFYLWRLFRRTYSVPGLGFGVQPKFLLIPAYSLAFIAWNTALHQGVQARGSLFGLLFWLATLATLVPTPLIEPRYYLIPYIVMRISCHSAGAERENGLRWKYLGLEAATCALVNAVTVALFVGKPFEWAPDAVDRARGEGTTMRFIW